MSHMPKAGMEGTVANKLGRLVKTGVIFRHDRVGKSSRLLHKNTTPASTPTPTPALFQGPKQYSQESSLTLLRFPLKLVDVRRIDALGYAFPLHSAGISCSLPPPQHFD